EARIGEMGQGHQGKAHTRRVAPLIDRRCKMRGNPCSKPTKEEITMRKLAVLVIGLAAAALGACSSMSSGSGWTVLFARSNLENWNAIGNANWRIADGT